MKKHSTGCSKSKESTPQTQPRISSIFKQTAQVTPQQLRFFKDKILRGVVEMCVLDSRPFNITHGEGFQEFSKQIYGAGKHFGSTVDVKELLPHRTTVRNSLLFKLYLYSSYRCFILDQSTS
jgi:hypothetical protein